MPDKQRHSSRLIGAQAIGIDERERIARMSNQIECDRAIGKFFSEKHRRIVVANRQGCCSRNSQRASARGPTQCEIDRLVFFVGAVVTNRDRELPHAGITAIPGEGSRCGYVIHSGSATDSRCRRTIGRRAFTTATSRRARC